MKTKSISSCGLFLISSLLLAPAAIAGAGQAPQTTAANSAAACLECHKAKDRTLMGEWEHVAMKSATIQLKIDNRSEVILFDKTRLQLVNTSGKGDKEKMLRSIKEGEAVAVRFVEKDGVKEAAVITVKAKGCLARKSNAPAKATVARIPKPGEFLMEEFIRISGAIPAGTVLLDVRNRDEMKDGTIRGAVNIPVQELFHGATQVPRDRKVIAYCNSGARAEMAYHILKAKGYDNIYFLRAHVDFDNGKPDIYN
ncbi:MAG TPA: rhodanese-like domain-containing protein [Desulfuromonadaceae bacterium]